MPPRFWEKVQQRPSRRFPGKPCWIWTGATIPQGYGRAWVDGRAEYTHRWTWMQLVGPIGAGLEVDHVCRVRACCNPEHLALTTRRDNLQAKGSQAFVHLHALGQRCSGWPRCFICRYTESGQANLAAPDTTSSQPG
jgi:hypothetical protein